MYSFPRCLLFALLVWSPLPISSMEKVAEIFDSVNISALQPKVPDKEMKKSTIRVDARARVAPFWSRCLVLLGVKIATVLLWWSPLSKKILDFLWKNVNDDGNIKQFLGRGPQVSSKHAFLLLSLLLDIVVLLSWFYLDNRYLMGADREKKGVRQHKP